MKPRLKDDRGAVMVMAVFVALLLVGILYHVAGVGGAALEQQIMQDAADATAFSAAAVHARGMNIIAMLNLLMVALLTILVALRLVQAILTALLAAVTLCAAIVVSPATASFCAGLITPVEKARSGIADAADAYQKVAKKLIKGLAQAESAVNEVVPFIALGEGLAISKGPPYDKVSNGGIVWPIFDGLPTKKGEYSDLCKRAGENIAAPMGFLLPGDLGDFAEENLGSLIGELTETFSMYFCGDDGSGGSPDKPEDKTIKKEVGYPPGIDKDNEALWSCAGVHPEEQSGRCYGDNCRDCAKTACDFCLKEMKNDGNYKRGQWTVVKNDWVEWIEADGKIQQVIARNTEPDRWSQKIVDGNPCLHEDNPNPSRYENETCSGYSHKWGYFENDFDSESVRKKEYYYPRLICERIEEEPVTDREDISYYLQQIGSVVGRPPSGEAAADTPEMTLQKQTIYLALSSCVVKEEIDVKAEGKPMVGPGEDSSDMAPRVLDPEKFPKQAKITSVLLGKRKANNRLKGVSIASKEKLGDDKSENRFGFASAEYYSQNSDDEAMWHMKWLSRLVRFQWSNGDQEDQYAPQDIQSNNADGLDMMSQAKSSISDKLGVDVDDYLLH
jgi:hypothetical protein